MIIVEGSYLPGTLQKIIINVGISCGIQIFTVAEDQNTR